MLTAAPATPSAAAVLRAQQISGAALPSAAPAASVHQPAACAAAVLTATTFGEGANIPASDGERHTGSGQQRGEKGVRERESGWYSGGDLRGSSGEILCSGDTAVIDSEGGLMVGTGEVCNGCTMKAGSSSSLGSGTGEVQMMRNNSWNSTSCSKNGAAVRVAGEHNGAAGNRSSGSSSAYGGGSGNGGSLHSNNPAPTTPKSEYATESARAARARARAATTTRHEAELRELDWLDQQVEEAVNSPSTPTVAAELRELEQEFNRVQLQWQRGSTKLMQPQW
jgi:HAMP domain-containing protein